MLICVTGVSGAGKTTVLRRASGVCPIVFLDAVVHGLYTPGQAGSAAVAAAFGPDYLCPSGVDRARLGRLAFADPNAMTRLNDAVYPCVADFLAKLREAAAAGVVAVEAAAFLTNRDKYAKYFDRTVLITAPEARVAASNRQRFGVAPGFSSRIFGQVNEGDFDLVLHNGGDPADAGAALRA